MNQRQKTDGLGWLRLRLWSLHVGNYRGDWNLVSQHGETMKVLDLFCGMGGWSIGFHREGFTCYGLDEVDVGYPYELWQTPIEEFRGGEYRDMGFDVVVASPPCTEFSILSRGLAAMGKRKPPEPEKGMALVKEALRVIQLVQPRYWLIENVSGAVKYFSPVMGAPKAIIKPYYLWGNFPRFLRESSYMAPKIHKMGLKNGSMLDAPGRFSPLAPWLRAKIPFPLSLGLARACKDRIITYQSESKP